MDRPGCVSRRTRPAGRAARHVGVMREMLVQCRYSPRWSGLSQSPPILACLVASSRFRPISCRLVSPHAPSYPMMPRLHGVWHICMRTKRSDRGRHCLVELASLVNGHSRRTCAPPQHLHHRHMPSYRAASASYRTVPYKYAQDGHLAGLRLGTAYPR